MSYTKIWIHCVWSTKNREHFLTSNIRPVIFKHIKDIAVQKDIFIDFINGYYDHAHALITLGRDQAISQIMQSIKGESSHWINNNNLTSRHFIWQDDYWAASVSPSDVRNVRNYIRYQAIHHRTVSLEFEVRCLFNENSFEKFKDSG